jgi:hypothetical protein
MSDIDEVQFWKDRFEHANAEHESAMQMVKKLVGKLEKPKWKALSRQEVRNLWLMVDNGKTFSEKPHFFAKEISERLRELNT